MHQLFEKLFEEQDILLQKEDYVSPTEDSKVTNNLKIVWKPAKQVQLSKKMRRTPSGRQPKQ